MSSKLDWSALEVGKTYYLLGYSDFKRFYPDIETLIYLGLEKAGDSERNEHVFEYACAREERDGSGAPFDEDTIRFSDDDPSCVGDLDGLIEELEHLRSRLAHL